MDSIKADFSNEELRLAAKDIIEFHETAIMPDGIFKQFTKEIRSKLGDTYSITLAENMIKDEIMKRYVNGLITSEY